MRNTLQEASKESGFGSLSKAGASAIGVSQTPKAAEMPQVKGNGTTQHWKSTYSNVIDESLQQPVQKSLRPEWSLPRQAYSSKRSFFFTEQMKSFGNYGDNPLKRLHEQKGMPATDLHELK